MKRTKKRVFFCLSVLLLIMALPVGNKVTAFNEEYTVTYAPGEQGRWSESEASYQVTYGSPTPVFGGDLTALDSGWTFFDWSPKVMTDVLGDVQYQAIWQKIEGGFGYESRTFLYDDLTITIEKWGFGASLDFQVTIIENAITKTSEIIRPSESGTYFLTIDFEGIHFELMIHGTRIDGINFELTRYSVIYDAGSNGLLSDGRRFSTYYNLPLNSPTPLVPTVLADSGWVFTGWDKEWSPLVSDNVVYTAIYQLVEEPPLTYSVTYSPGIYGTFNSLVYSGLIYGEPTPPPPLPLGKEGYVFSEWSPQVSSVVAGDVVYTAVWKTSNPPVTGDRNPDIILVVLVVTCLSSCLFLAKRRN